MGRTLVLIPCDVYNRTSVLRIRIGIQLKIPLTYDHSWNSPECIPFDIILWHNISPSFRILNSDVSHPTGLTRIVIRFILAKLLDVGNGRTPRRRRNLWRVCIRHQMIYLWETIPADCHSRRTRIHACRSSTARSTISSGMHEQRV